MEVLTVVIEENGDMTFLDTPHAQAFADAIGHGRKQRASHVEPASFWLRVLFHVLRFFASDKDRIAEWTRHWPCRWRVNTSPVGGPILRLHDVYDWCGCPRNSIATFHDRQNAINAEIKFLNKWFLERGEQ